MRWTLLMTEQWNRWIAEEEEEEEEEEGEELFLTKSALQLTLFSWRLLQSNGKSARVTLLPSAFFLLRHSYYLLTLTNSDQLAKCHAELTVACTYTSPLFVYLTSSCRKSAFFITRRGFNFCSVRPRGEMKGVGQSDRFSRGRNAANKEHAVVMCTRVNSFVSSHLISCAVHPLESTCSSRQRHQVESSLRICTEPVLDRIVIITMIIIHVTAHSV